LLDRFGLFRDETNVAELSELGVLFLLFEQGL
jgi:Kef-type K+ transport system membrane component KefB